MAAKATHAATSRALELETDAATLKRMLAMIAGTVGVVSVLGVSTVLFASGSFKSMLGYPTYVTHHRTEADRLAGKVVMGCKLGAVALAASRDENKAAAGRELAGQCDEVGAVIKSLPVTR